MLALIFTANALPMIIGSLSGWWWLAGMTARPPATSSRTSLAAHPLTGGDERHLRGHLTGPRPLQLRAAIAHHPRPRRQPRSQIDHRLSIGVRARGVVQVQMLTIGQAHPPKRHFGGRDILDIEVDVPVDLRAARNRASGYTEWIEAESSDCGISQHLPTPALPGQVRTVDGPSRPLSALGVRSRVRTLATLAQRSGAREYRIAQRCFV